MKTAASTATSDDARAKSPGERMITSLLLLKLPIDHLEPACAQPASLKGVVGHHHNNRSGGGPLGEQVFDRPHGNRVERPGWFVEECHGSIDDKPAHQRQALAFPGR